MDDIRRFNKMYPTDTVVSRKEIFIPINDENRATVDPSIIKSGAGMLKPLNNVVPLCCAGVVLVVCLKSPEHHSNSTASVSVYDHPVSNRKVNV